MTRKTWCMTLGAVLALGGAAKADDGPCKAPKACNAARRQPADPKPDVSSATGQVIKDEVLQTDASKKLRLVTYQVAHLIMPIGNEDGDLAPFIYRKYSTKNKRKPGETAEDVLLWVITSTIAPDSWSDTGGKGTIQYFPLGLALVVNQTAEVQEQVAALLTALQREQAEVDIEYRLNAMLFEDKGGVPEPKQLPAITFVRGQPVTVRLSGSVVIRDGSIRDLGGQEEMRFGANPEKVPTGLALRVNATAAEGSRIRIDMTVRNCELVAATRDGLQLQDQAYRLIRRVEPGSSQRMVLSENERGEPRVWLDFVLTRVPPREDCEVIKQDSLPPVPR